MAKSGRLEPEDNIYRHYTPRLHSMQRGKNVSVPLHSLAMSWDFRYPCKLFGVTDLTGAIPGVTRPRDHARSVTSS